MAAARGDVGDRSSTGELDEFDAALQLQEIHIESPWQNMPRPSSYDADSVRHKIDLARHLLQAERPLAALEQLTDALRDMGGEGMVMETLQRARESYWSGQQVDALAQLLQMCAIEAGPVPLGRQATPDQPRYDERDNSDSVLAQTDRSHLLRDAFSSDLTVVCPRCRGIISSQRSRQHIDMWCPALPEQHSDDDDCRGSSVMGIDGYASNTCMAMSDDEDLM